MGKLIETMADDLLACHVEFSDGVGGIYTDYEETARRMVAKGYRKQSEGEWIGEADGYADGEFVYDVWYCSRCNHCIDDGTDDSDLLPNFCPHCGAKMKGAE